jgi:hypothetical protein
MGDLAPRFIPVNCRRRAAEGVDLLANSESTPSPAPDQGDHLVGKDGADFDLPSQGNDVLTQRGEVDVWGVLDLRHVRLADVPCLRDLSLSGASGLPQCGLGADSAPLGLRAVPALTNVAATAMPTDIVIYAMANKEADFATLLRFLAFNRGTVAQVAVERGYQRSDKREQFGFLDGLRNVPTENRVDLWLALIGLAEDFAGRWTRSARPRGRPPRLASRS